MSLDPRYMNDQQAYEFGYDNPDEHWRDHQFGHSVQVHAFLCGQTDACAKRAKNPDYQYGQYDSATYAWRFVPTPSSGEELEFTGDEWVYRKKTL